MTFEADGTRVVQPLDPYKGPRYTEPIDDTFEEDMLDQIYNTIAWRREDYSKPTEDWLVSWRSIHSFDSDSEEAMYDWQACNHELSTRRCASAKTVHWIGSELWDRHVYNGIEYF